MVLGGTQGGPFLPRLIARDTGRVGASEIRSGARSPACGWDESGAVIETKCRPDTTSARPVVGSGDMTMGVADVR